jgi:hypothetical protein
VGGLGNPGEWVKKGAPCGVYCFTGKKSGKAEGNRCFVADKCPKGEEWEAGPSTHACMCMFVYDYVSGCGCVYMHECAGVIIYACINYICVWCVCVHAFVCAYM